MATGAGLDAQLVYGAETTWGTPVTPDHAVEFDSESLSFDPGFVEPTGLRPGRIFKRSNRVIQSRKSVSGDFTLEVPTKGIGLLLKHCLGSTVTTPTAVVGKTGAFSQIHTPSGTLGLGLTVQVGRPQPSDGTVEPFTFAGCKVTGWEFDLKDNAIPTWKVTVDGRDETTSTALVTPSYPSGAAVFDFTQASLKLGGTAATASGETTITGGTAVATIITDITITGATPAATERYGLGNAGLKAQQLQNDTPTITGKLSAEFNKTELYDVFKANTATAMQLDLTGSAIGTSGANFLLSFIMPSVRLKTATPNVSGPDIVQMDTSFEVYDDEANPVIQVKIVSDESTL